MANRLNAKGRRITKQFTPLFHDLLHHPNYVKLSNRAIRLLNDLMAQYNGHNNGDLSACMTLMSGRGWASKSSLQLALRELEYYQFVKVSRQGGRNMPTLLALTCFSIDECKGKHDLRVTSAANNEYKLTKKKWNPKQKQNPYPICGATYPTGGAMGEEKAPITPYVGHRNG